MTNAPCLAEAADRGLAERLLRYFRAYSLRTKLLLTLWAFFLLLVALGVHGSSIPVSAIYWKPESHYAGYTDYFFEPVVNLLKARSGGKTGELPRLLGSYAQPIRSDEWLCSTPWCLSQCAHTPAFPVINTNIGVGQNMLLIYNSPVWHVAALARPGTWGYLLFGSVRGLAWQWWFSVFSCFTVLYLLLEIMLLGKKRLAAFGAFWFCSSAYIIGWSLLPAYVAFFPTLSCLTAYHLLKSGQARIQLISGILLGLSVAGFVMCIYPPWQVVMGYCFLFVFVGLVMRDKLYRVSLSKSRLIALGVAILITAALLGAFVWSSQAAIATMSNTVYPGKRISTGGDYDFVALFKGFYNLLTMLRTPPCFANSCEASSFYLLFPAVFAGLVLSKWFRRNFDCVGWLLVFFLISLIYYMFHGIPASLAKITFLSYCPGARLDIALGMASILLCTYALGITSQYPIVNRSFWEKITTWLGALLVFGVFLLHGLLVVKITNLEIDINIILFASLLGGYISYCLLAGKAEPFCAVLGICIFSTAMLFNPLAQGLNSVYKSELAEQIVKFDREKADHPTWLVYGDAVTGTLIYALGGRTLNGIHFHPQLDIWRQFDPEGKDECIYNRYAHVSFYWNDTADPQQAKFSATTDSLFVVVSPHHSVFKKLGARYVLAMGGVQEPLSRTKLRLRYKSPQGHFSIFEILETSTL
ncbi:MAG: hypothetical protein V1899_03950 [Planctomycetota bacterium]